MLEISQIASKQVNGLKLGKSIKSKDGKFIFHVSIIDYLQKYDWLKRIERYYKINVNNAKGEELSSMPSEPYRKRFMQFMRDKVFVERIDNENAKLTRETLQDFSISHERPVIHENHYTSTQGVSQPSRSEVDEAQFLANKIILEDINENAEEDNILSGSNSKNISSN